MIPIYPYLNVNDLNLDFLLRTVRVLEMEIKNFVNFNKIKYADPLAWNITTQYEANTVVIDPVTGIAYLSTQAVPNGVAITNTDYWTAIFDMSVFFNGLGNINDLLTTDKTSVVNAINEVFTNELKSRNYVTPQMYGAIGDGVTDDSNAIQDAIDHLLSIGGGTLFFPSGTYKVSQTLNCTDSSNHYVSLLGNEYASQIIYDGAGTLFYYEHTTPYQKIVIEKLYMKANDVGTAISFDGSNDACNVIIRDNEIWHFSTAIVCDGECDEWSVEHNHIAIYNYGLHIKGLSGGWSILNNHFENGNDGSFGIYSLRLHTTSITANVIQSPFKVTLIHCENSYCISVSELYGESIDTDILKPFIHFVNSQQINFNNIWIGGVGAAFFKFEGCELINIISVRLTTSGGNTLYFIDNDASCKTIRNYQQFPYPTGFTYFTRNPIEYGIVPYYNVVNDKRVTCDYYNIATVNGYEWAQFDISADTTRNGLYLIQSEQIDENRIAIGIIAKGTGGLSYMEIKSTGYPTGYEPRLTGTNFEVYNDIGGARSIIVSMKKIL